MAKKEKERKEVVPAGRPDQGPWPLAREMDRLFDEFWRRPFGGLMGMERLLPSLETRMPWPTLDVYEDKGDVVVKSDIPGMTKEDIEVNLTGTTLTISGEKKKSEEVKEKDYYRSERSHGMFRRSVDLPAEVQTDKVTATFKDGVLEIRLPKSEEAKKKERAIRID